MAAIAFQIEVVEPESGLVLARQLEPRAFRIRPDTRFGGCALSGMTLPRLMGEDGAPRLDVYAFRLARREESARFRPGEIAELSDWWEPPRLLG